MPASSGAISPGRSTIEPVGHSRHRRANREHKNAIRDPREGVGLDHLPLGWFAANGASLAIAVMAHNLARWTARIARMAWLPQSERARARYNAVPRPSEGRAI